MIYPDKKNKSITSTGTGPRPVLRAIALVIAFISVFGFLFKILFF